LDQEKKIESECPYCHALQKFQGYRQRKIHVGNLGIFSLTRAYYTCRSCGRSEFPLDKQLDLTSNLACGKFEEQICNLSSTMPFDHVRKYLLNYEQIDVTETMIRETAERCGNALIRADELAIKKLTVGNESGIKIKCKNPNTLYLQADGAFVPIIGDDGHVEYYENKLAVGFTDQSIKRDKKNRATIKQKSFSSSLARGVNHFELALKKMAYELGSKKAKKIVFISDGAPWIDNIRERQFPGSIHILDWYHVIEKLHTLSRKLFEDDEKGAKEWVKPLKTLLWNGNAKKVCDLLREEIQKEKKHKVEIESVINYYTKRKDKMQYKKFRRKGYFIGSGTVESANKYLVAQRLKQAGMKWTKKGASAIIKLREKMYDNYWDDVWKNRKLYFSYI